MLQNRAAGSEPRNDLEKRLSLSIIARYHHKREGDICHFSSLMGLNCHDSKRGPTAVMRSRMNDWLGQLDYRRPRAAERAFAERATHAFPPSAELPAEWRRELEALAQQLGYRTAKAVKIKSEFATVLQQIAAAVPSRTLIELPLVFKACEQLTQSSQ